MKGMNRTSFQDKWITSLTSPDSANLEFARTIL